MPPVSFVHLLPKEVRDELVNRLTSNGFGQYEALSEWLKSLGHDIGKTAIHRFGSQLKSDIENKIPESSYPMIDFRLRCIEAAVNSGASDVFEVAQSYFDWVTPN